VLTPLEKHLILGLKLMGCNELDAVAIMLQLNAEESHIAMMDWMCEHPNATPAQLLHQSSIISMQEECER